ncbi:MAG: hypothetical protein IJP82_01865 [Bacteroidaceae bacterium]|nr:hypothetical protein [Bacteroidaceae bacterium]
MKRILFLLISLMLVPSSNAQTKTDQTVQAITQYLNEHCAWGYVTDAVCGRNHSVWSNYGVDNGPMRATATLLDSIQPFLNQLPHKRRMTDEQADELFKGRIAMRLHPEKGDTSAYFLMDYNRSNISFKYGVNSPQSINIITEHSYDHHVNFNYRDLPADRVVPITELLSQMEQRSHVLVKDTTFCYVEGGNYDWWMGKKGEESRTPAHVVLQPNAEMNDFLDWLGVFAPLAGSPDFTLYNTYHYEQGQELSFRTTASFSTGGMFCLYHAVYYQKCLCMVRIVVPTWEQCAVVPDVKELIEHSQGKETRTPGFPIASATFEGHMDTFMKELLQRKGTQVIDTLFVSSDKEGHSLWNGLDDRCPTSAKVVRTPYPAKDFVDLRAQVLSIYKDNAMFSELNDEECQFFILSWRDETYRFHAAVFYYYPDGRLSVVRADGEQPRQICIPHYSHEWFDKK